MPVDLPEARSLAREHLVVDRRAAVAVDVPPPSGAHRFRRAAVRLDLDDAFVHADAGALRLADDRERRAGHLDAGFGRLDVEARAVEARTGREPHRAGVHAGLD